MTRESVTQVLDHPEVRVQQTEDAPSEQCQWCQLDGALCCLTITWTPRSDVLSDGYQRCCLTCVELPMKWALDDALTGSIVTVEMACGEVDE